jgi:hypothetical protein
MEHDVPRIAFVSLTKDVLAALESLHLHDSRDVATLGRVEIAKQGRVDEKVDDRLE